VIAICGGGRQVPCPARWSATEKRSSAAVVRSGCRPCSAPVQGINSSRRRAAEHATTGCAAPTLSPFDAQESDLAFGRGGELLQEIARQGRKPGATTTTCMQIRSSPIRSSHHGHFLGIRGENAYIGSHAKRSAPLGLMIAILAMPSPATPWGHRERRPRSRCAWIHRDGADEAIRQASGREVRFARRPL